MVNPNNDNIELAMAKERYTAPSAPLTEEYANGTSYEKSDSKRSPSRKRCCVTMVVVLVVIGAGTILLYEYLLGWQPSDSENSPEPEVARSSFKLPGLGNRGPKMNDPNPEDSSRLSSLSTTELVFINSTTELIFIDATPTSKRKLSGSTKKVPSGRKKDKPKPDDEYSGSGDDDTERSGDGMQGDEARGSGDGIK